MLLKEPKAFGRLRNFSGMSKSQLCERRSSNENYRLLCIVSSVKRRIQAGEAKEVSAVNVVTFIDRKSFAVRNYSEASKQL